MPRRRSKGPVVRPRLRPNARPSRQRAEGHLCDCRGCGEEGIHRAPVAPDRLDVYYWLCLEHVRAYNTTWNYCAGMSDSEIEAHIRADTVGWRPTWPLGELGGQLSRARFERLREELGLFGKGGGGRAKNGHRTGKGHGVVSAHKEALIVFDLTPPVTVVVLKARYKELVKRHHPDANGGDKEAEERLKLINQAYATLRDAFDA